MKGSDPHCDGVANCFSDFASGYSNGILNWPGNQLRGLECLGDAACRDAMPKQSMLDALISSNPATAALKDQISLAQDFYNGHYYAGGQKVGDKTATVAVALVGAEGGALLGGLRGGGAVAADAATAARSITLEDGLVIPASRSALEEGFARAGFPSRATGSAGTEWTLPNGWKVRVMEPAGPAPLRASFTNAAGDAIDPLTGKAPQPVGPYSGLTSADWRKVFRSLTHLELDP